jgi:hypothetical protein
MSKKKKGFFYQENVMVYSSAVTDEVIDSTKEKYGITVRTRAERTAEGWLDLLDYAAAKAAKYDEDYLDKVERTLKSLIYNDCVSIYVCILEQQKHFITTYVNMWLTSQLECSVTVQFGDTGEYQTFTKDNIWSPKQQIDNGILAGAAMEYQDKAERLETKISKSLSRAKWLSYHLAMPHPDTWEYLSSRDTHRSPWDITGKDKPLVTITPSEGQDIRKIKVSDIEKNPKLRQALRTWAQPLGFNIDIDNWDDTSDGVMDIRHFMQQTQQGLYVTGMPWDDQYVLDCLEIRRRRVSASVTQKEKRSASNPNDVLMALYFIQYCELNGGVESWLNDWDEVWYDTAGLPNVRPKKVWDTIVRRAEEAIASGHDDKDNYSYINRGDKKKYTPEDEEHLDARAAKEAGPCTTRKLTYDELMEVLKTNKK